MTLDPGVLTLVLLAALCHATWNSLVKAGGDKLVMQTLVISTPGVICVWLTPFVPFPAAEGWVYLAASQAVHMFYYAALIYAYEHGDLSQVYPISRGSAPALVAVFAWLFAGEILSLLETTGLVILSLGIISLSRLVHLMGRSGTARPGEVKAISFALLTALTIGSYSFLDGMGVRSAGTTSGYIVWKFCVAALPLLAFTLWRRRARLADSFRPYFAKGIAGGLFAGLAYGIVMWALAIAPMAHVIALRETSVIIAAFIGTRLMGEPFGHNRMAAACAVTAGAALLNLAG